jgi:hypothetical protein
MGKTIDSGGGAVVEGGVGTGGGPFIGRDQNNLYFLDPINDAARMAEVIAALARNTDFQKDRGVANVVADLNDLMEELSETHKTIVKMVSPLRRVSDDHAQFADEFRVVYADFRDCYDAYDFRNERTKCHVIRRLRGRLLQRKRLFGAQEQWERFDRLLGALDTADEDIIESQYVPFMENINARMKVIMHLVESGATAEALVEKSRFLEALEPEYSQTKAMLKEMTDAIGALTTLMESSAVA